MPVKYIPYLPNPIAGQALLNNIPRSERLLRYRDNDKVVEKIQRGLPYYDLETVEQVGEDNKGWNNLLLRGECLSACAYLKDQGISVDLVYIDPPFASGANYAKKVYLRRNPQRAGQVAQAEQELEQEGLHALEETMYGDIWQKEDYLNWMYENLMAIKSVMSETASIYVHLDWHIGHYVKILMDEVFGEDNFKNEIIWHFIKGASGNGNFGRKHQTIFWYSKSENVIFNRKEVGVEYNPETIARAKRGEARYHAAEEDLFEKGKNPGDVWSDLHPVQGNSIENTGYVTQKPEALLERIIKASSDEGMIVVDFFGGSGVTAKVAHDLGRKFIHCDVGINSLQTTRDRLADAGAGFQVMDIGEEAGFSVRVTEFYSDRLQQKIAEYNDKRQLTGSNNSKPLLLSDEGLELIEWLAVDCKNADGPWHSSHEVKIDKNGYATINGNKTRQFWDGTIVTTQAPQRIKIRNIGGDETIKPINPQQ